MSIFKESMKIKRDYKAIKRFLKISETFTVYGFNEFTSYIYPKRRRLKRNVQYESMSRAEKLRHIFEELGPTFVKLGQILSTRPDLIPNEYAQEFTKLTESVAPFPKEKAIELFKSELNKNPNEIFNELSYEPIAAASIGQAYKAKLKDGTPVIIKLRRPDIDKTIELDLEIMRYIAEKLESFSIELERMRITKIIEEFAYSLNRELDYRCEVANILTFTKKMQGSTGLFIPKVYQEISTSKILVMDLVEGYSAGEIIENLDKYSHQFNYPQIAECGVSLLLKQIFETGFFHADPHPGNIFIMPNSNIAFIDFGMMGKVSEAERNNFIKIIDYMLKERIDLMVNVALKMTISGKIFGDKENFIREVSDMVDQNINLPIEKLSVANILESLLELLSKYKLSLKPNLYLMFKALITIEKIGRTFDPKMQIIESVKPFIMRMKIKSLSPTKFLSKISETLPDNFEFLQSLPTTLREILDKVQNDQIKLKIEHHRLDDIEETLFIAGERMSRSMIITAIIIGSSLLAVAKVPPYWNNIPIIGTSGFLTGVIIGLLMLLDDYRRRRKFLKQRKRTRLRNKYFK